MQNLQDLQEKIFFESKNILNALSKINSKEELLSKQDLFAEVTDRIAFLRILEKNKDSFATEIAPENSHNQEFNSDRNFNNSQEHFDDAPFEEDMIEEEVIFTNEINDIDEEHVSDDLPVEILKTENTVEDEIIDPVLSENIENEQDVLVPESASEKEVSLVEEPENSNYEEGISQKEKEFLEAEERRRKIVEFIKEDTHPAIDEVFHKEKESDQLTERKFKLANIKGLKAVQNLFDEDPLDKLQEKESENTDSKSDSGSLLKTNLPTDFMEAPKKHPEFKLDFNDKIAFTKLLFKGNEEELKSTIDHLNSFDDLEGARQYLSEIYYLKNWSKADEYAQRLWNLVESKFL